MLTQLQLEGPELEPLLARVRNELGSSARIVQAEKIRSGGVAGFFARERYELTVEIDSGQRRALSAAASPVPSARAVPAIQLGAASVAAPAAAVPPAAASPAGSAPATLPSPVAPTAAAPAASAAPPAHSSQDAQNAPAARSAASAAAPPTPAPVGTPALLVPTASSAALAGVAMSNGSVPTYSAIAGLTGPAASPSDDAGLLETLVALTEPPSARPPAVDPRPSATVAGPNVAAPTAPAIAAAAAAAAYATASSPAADLDLWAAEGDAAPAVVVEQLTADAPRRAALRSGAAALEGTSADGPAGFAPLPAFAGAAAALDRGEPTGREEQTEAPVEPRAARSLLELADQISADEHAAVVSTETPSFASLLSRLGSVAGADGPAPVDAGVDRVALAPPVLDAAAAPRPTALTEIVAPTVLSPDPAVLPELVLPELVLPELVLPELRLTDLVLPDAPQAAEVGPEGAPEPADAASAAQADTGAELARLGLPSHLRPTCFDEPLLAALRASLTQLPTAPPAFNRAGAVLAIVGPLSQALHVAREIAEELGLPAATSVAVATSGTAAPDVTDRQVVHGADEAAEKRATWRRRSNLTVVAVDAPLTASGAEQARGFLAALSPSATWGAVEATRKAQDVASWTRALGGVQALALTDLEETSDPAAVLELGIPVSRLGSRPATPRAWATLLTGRLEA